MIHKHKLRFMNACHCMSFVCNFWGMLLGIWHFYAHKDKNYTICEAELNKLCINDEYLFMFWCTHL